MPQGYFFLSAKLAVGKPRKENCFSKSHQTFKVVHWLGWLPKIGCKGDFELMQAKDQGSRLTLKGIRTINPTYPSAEILQVKDAIVHDVTNFDEVNIFVDQGLTYISRWIIRRIRRRRNSGKPTIASRHVLCCEKLFNQACNNAGLAVRRDRNVPGGIVVHEKYNRSLTNEIFP